MHICTSKHVFVHDCAYDFPDRSIEQDTLLCYLISTWERTSSCQQTHKDGREFDVMNLQERCVEGVTLSSIYRKEVY